MLEQCYDSTTHIHSESIMTKSTGEKEDVVAPSSSVTPNKNEGNDAAADALLARLQSQFGDMDLSTLTGNAGNQDHDTASAQEKDEETNEEVEEDAMSEESSVVEPTPEEVQAWQEAQYKLGKWATQAKEDAKKSKADKAAEIIRKRRTEKKKKLAFLSASVESGEEWEKVYSPPDLGNQESIFFPSHDENGTELVGPHPILSELARSGDPEVLGGKWNLLYSSNSDGLSFHRLLDSLRGYSGPTVMLIGAEPAEKHRLDSSSRGNKKKAMKTGTLGLFTTTPWEGESSDFFGTDDCFLFRFNEDDESEDGNDGKSGTRQSQQQRQQRKERVSIVRPITEKGNYMYCNPSSTFSSRARGTDKALSGVIQYGIGAGGTSSRLRLHLTENFESCRALTLAEGTFAEGHLLPPEWGEDCFYYFDVDALEVWGVGGEEWIETALKARDYERDKVEANLRKARSIDKRQLVDHFRSDALLGGENSLFGHLDQVQGRVDDCRLIDRD